MVDPKKKFSAVHQTLILDGQCILFNYILRMVQDRADAEDLTQEVFVKVYQNLSSFCGESKLSTWLYRLATNLCVDHFRKKFYKQKKATGPLEIRASTGSDQSCACQVCEDGNELPVDEVVIKSEINNSMKCEEFKRFIQSYLDKELPEAIENEWRQHLEECHACRSEVRIYEKCIVMMQRFMGEELPPKTLQERLKQKLGCDCFDFCLPEQRSEGEKNEIDNIRTS